MLITPHMLIGAAIGVHSNNIGMAFLFGLISHYLLDFLPHWEYLTGLKITKVSQAIKLILDFILGIVLVLVLIWNYSEWAIVASAIFGALLPDFIGGIYENFKIKQLKVLYDIHNKLHYPREVSFWKGLPLTLLIFLIAIFLLV